MMLQAGNFMSSLTYIIISAIVGVALVAAGYYIIRP